MNANNEEIGHFFPLCKQPQRVREALVLFSMQFGILKVEVNFGVLTDITYYCDTLDRSCDAF